MGAPIRKAMKKLLAKQNDFQPCQIDYRKQESFWVTGTDKDVTCTFQVQFDGEEDQSLARIFLMELHTCRKNVTNCPAIFYNDKTPPEDIERIFPGSNSMARSNGCISFKVSEAHLKKGIDLPLS